VKRGRDRPRAGSACRMRCPEPPHDEKVGVARSGCGARLRHVPNPLQIDVVSISARRRGIQSQLVGIALEVCVLEMRLMREQQVVHLPELSLTRGSSAAPRRQRMRMRFLQRKWENDRTGARHIWLGTARLTGSNTAFRVAAAEVRFPLETSCWSPVPNRVRFIFRHSAGGSAPHALAAAEPVRLPRQESSGRCTTAVRASGASQGRRPQALCRRAGTGFRAHVAEMETTSLCRVRKSEGGRSPFARDAHLFRQWVVQDSHTACRACTSGRGALHAPDLDGQPACRAEAAVTREPARLNERARS